MRNPLHLAGRFSRVRVSPPAAPGGGGNVPPAKPTLSAGSITGAGATLTGSAFSDPNPGDTQAAAQWQVTTSGDTGYASPIVSTGDDAAHLTIYAATGLSPSTAYRARARYKDSAGNYSPYSDDATFSTTAAGAATLLAAVTLTNESTSATDPQTDVLIGHPFVKADIPTGSRLKATWTPPGGVETGALPVQVSRVNAWPDSSVRFAQVAARLPSVPGSGSGAGTLKLYSESGTQATSLPAGKTATDIVNDLKANFPFTVTARNLRKGRESVAITNAGTGYPSGSLTLSFTGGTGGPPSDPGGKVTASGGTLIQPVWMEFPSVPYNSPPTVTITNPGSGTGGVLTAVIPPVDGSGSWTWSSVTQINFFLNSAGLDDGPLNNGVNKRTRCEVLDSGPLFALVHCTGPLVDDTGGALHPHLNVHGWYYCLLDQATGAIVRVMYAHALENGWIEDYNGGGVACDFQAGDFAVALNGVTVPGRSWNRICIPHHSSHLLTTIDGTATSGSRYLAGADWTSGGHRLRPKFDNYYWRKSRLIPPYDFAFFDPARGGTPILPAEDNTPSTYAPGARIPGKMTTSFNVGGEGEHLGLMPHWSVKALHQQSPGYLQSDLATALYGGHMTCRIMNPQTGRIPSLIKDAGFLSGQQPPGMGPTRAAVTRYLTSASINRSADIKMNIGAGTNVGGNSQADPTNTDGGWFVSGDGWDTAHFPAICYHQYLRTGAPWLLHTMTVHANIPLMWRQPGLAVGQNATHGFGRSRDRILPDGTTLYGCFTRDSCGGERVEAWAWKLISQWLAVAPDSAVEKPYFQRTYNVNSTAAITIINSGDYTNSDNFRNLGVWAFEGSISTSRFMAFGTPFMWKYFFHARGFEAGALDRPADCLAFLTWNMKSLKAQAGDDPNQSCSWTMDQFHVMYGTPDGDYFADWSQVPFWLDNGTASFDAATGYVAHSMPVSLDPQLPLHTEGLYPIVDGDLVMFHDALGNGFGVGSKPPAELTPCRLYYIRDSDPTVTTVGSLKQSKFKLAATPGGPALSFSTSPTNVGLSFKLASCPVPSSAPGSIQARATGDISAVGDMTQTLYAANFLVLAGLATTSDPFYQNILSRTTAARTFRNWPGNNQDWVNFPKYKSVAAV